MALGAQDAHVALRGHDVSFWLWPLVLHKLIWPVLVGAQLTIEPLHTPLYAPCSTSNAARYIQLFLYPICQRSTHIWAINFLNLQYR